MSNESSVFHARSAFGCGLVSGLIQSGLFNAYDRAFFHSVVHGRSFLHRANWRGSLLFGVSPAFLQRSISAGLYFPLEETFRNRVSESHAVDGLLVGLVGGVFTTPFNSVKYAMWSDAALSGKQSSSMYDTALSLYKRAGVTRLMRGAMPTLYRDVSFGITYSFLRYQGDNGFLNNVGAAAIATAVSAPFNFARLKIYGADGLKKATANSSTWDVLKELNSDAMKNSRSSVFGRAEYLVRSMNLGWGALRVGLGMGIGSQIYKVCNV